HRPRRIHGGFGVLVIVTPFPELGLPHTKAPGLGLGGRYGKGSGFAATGLGKDHVVGVLEAVKDLVRGVASRPVLLTAIVAGRLGDVSGDLVAVGSGPMCHSGLSPFSHAGVCCLETDGGARPLTMT